MSKQSDRMKYTQKTEITFAAAHTLAGCGADGAAVHGHNFRVEFEVAGYELDEYGMGLDFREIRGLAAREVIDDLDHSFLNETPPFDEINPTAENIGALVFSRVHRLIHAHSGGRFELEAVTAWEDHRDSVRVSASSR